MAKISSKKYRSNNSNNRKSINRKSSNRKSRYIKSRYIEKSRKLSRKKQWFCFGTMTILSNHKRTAEKYLNQLDDAGVKPEEIKIYQGKGQGAAGYSRINICYYAKKKLINSTF